LFRWCGTPAIIGIIPLILGGVDIAEKYENKDYVYGSLNVTPTDLNEIVTRVTRPTVASTGGAGIQRKYTDFVY
jgi:cadmium resistance protein CadD (predicted permease)